MRGAIDRATLTTTIDITRNGRSATIKGVGTSLTDGYIGSGQAIARVCCTDSTLMVTNMTLVATAIDITCRTTLHINIGTGNKSISGISKVISTEQVIQTTGTTTSIDILLDLAAKHSNVCCTIDIASECDLGITQTTTIDITIYYSTLIDNDVGIVLLCAIQLRRRLIVQLSTITEVLQIGGSIIRIICPGLIRIIISINCPCCFPVFLPTVQGCFSCCFNF